MAGLKSGMSVGYGREIGMIMLIYIMAMAYAASSPIILPFALCYFITAWVGHVSFRLDAHAGQCAFPCCCPSDILQAMCYQDCMMALTCQDMQIMTGVMSWVFAHVRFSQRVVSCR